MKPAQEIFHAASRTLGRAGIMLKISVNYTMQHTAMLAQKY
jgi:hypothetical protein